jgi:transposase
MRPGVLWRKGSVGTHSPEGSRFVEALMTVVATLKQPHRHVLDSLTAAWEAPLHRKAAPSLLPTPAVLEQIRRPAASLDERDHRLLFPHDPVNVYAESRAQLCRLMHQRYECRGPVLFALQRLPHGAR